MRMSSFLAVVALAAVSSACGSFIKFGCVLDCSTSGPSLQVLPSDPTVRAGETVLLTVGRVGDQPPMKGKMGFVSEDVRVAVVRPWPHGCHTYHCAELIAVAPGTTSIVLLLDGKRSPFKTRVTVISAEPTPP